MSSRICAVAAVAALMLTCFSVAAKAAQTRTHYVRDILLDGKQVQTVDGVTVTRGGSVAHALRVGEAVPDGTRIDVPARVSLVIASTGDKSAATLNPGASVTFVSTGSGEALRSNSGTTLFDVVPHALDFFSVQSGEALTASVHGTIFSIDAASGSVAYACKRGEISVQKHGYLVIGGKRLKTSLVDVLSSQGHWHATYHPTDIWELARFDNFAQAEAFYRAQLEAAQKSGDDAALNAARTNLGNVLRLESKYDAALDVFGQALAYYDSNGDRDRQARTLEGIGLVRYWQDRNEAALVVYRQALALALAVGDDGAVADSYKDIAQVQKQLSDYPTALALHRKALALYERLGDREGTAEELVDIGEIDLELANYDEASALLSRARAEYASLHDGDGEGSATQSIGIIALYQSRYNDATALFHLALQLYRHWGDLDREAYTLMDIGITQERQGRYADAEQSFDAFIAVLRKLGENDAESNYAMQIGTLREKQGRYVEALRAFSRSRALAIANGNAYAAANAALGIAVVQLDEGHDAGALQSLRGLLNEFQKLDDFNNQSKALEAASRAETGVGDEDAAWRFGSQALALDQKLQDRYAEAAVRLTLGDILRVRHDDIRALQSYREALSIYEDIGNVPEANIATQRIDALEKIMGQPFSPAPKPSHSNIGIRAYSGRSRSAASAATPTSPL